MRRRRNTRYFIGFFVMWLCIGVGGFFVGYYVSNQDNHPPIYIVEEDPFEFNSDYNFDPGQQHTDEDDIDGRIVTSQQVIINEDTKIIFRTRYEKCQSIVDEVTEPLEEMIGLNKNEFDDFLSTNFQEWSQVGFSHNEVMLFKRSNQFCPDHFWVSQEDGYIAIYQFDETGNKKLVEKTEIPIATLPKIDQDRLINGIPLPTRDEVDKLLEDYSG